MLKPSNYGLPHDDWRPYQFDTVRWVEGVEENIVKITEQPTGCHAKGQGIMMFDGTIKPVENIEVGDKIMGPNGMPRTVKELIRGNSMMYKVIPVKGDPFIVNGDHVLTLVRTNCEPQSRNRKIRSDCRDGEIIDIAVNQWLNLSKTQKHIHKLFRVPINFNDYSNEIDPYFIGVLLGDGSIDKSRLTITTMDSEISNYLLEFCQINNLEVGVSAKKNNKAASYRILSGKQGNKKPIFEKIEKMGLIGKRSAEKFIPHQYKVASEFDRIQLLSGLLDTDGSLSGTSGYDFVSKSHQLANDVAFVARSLGLAAYVTQCYKKSQTGNGGIYYRVSISGSVDILKLKIKRKIPQKRTHKKDVLRTGFKIEECGSGEYYGFKLFGDPHYLLDDFTVTHNSGKSHIAMAQGTKGRRVIVLTKTKNLQVQYENGGYNATIVYGKQNYPCLHKLLPETATAEDCKYPGKMHKCDIAQDGMCSYFTKMNEAAESKRLVFNYALWFTTHQKWNPDYLIMDEAHNVSEMVLNHVGFEMSDKTRQRMEFPDFPIVKEPSKFIGATEIINGFDDVIDWANAVNSIVSARISRLNTGYAKTEQELARLRTLKNYQMKMESLRETLLNADTDHWFLRSGPNGQNGQPGILCKPITARYNTKDFFYKPRMMFMSATIGSVEAFAAELGIENYEARIVDSVWPIDTRPVYTLPVPSMGKSATEKDPKSFEKQADEIAKAIKDCPQEWSGFILVTRKSEAGLLAERLGRRGLADRVWITPGYDGEYSPTDEQVRAWEERKKTKPNSICITWAFWEGVDGREEKICVIAKAPFVMETEYERARRTFDSKFYLQRAAYTLEQGLGRTRRGNPEDYDDPEHDIQRGLVCIADASWKRLKPYMSKAIQEAIIEL